MRPFFEKARPTTQRSQPTINDPVMRATVMEKIKKVIKQRYLTTTIGATIKSYIKYFAVPKGEDDIRMVYDATANKLNDAVWAPSFWLPTIDTLVRNVGKDLWMTDRDVLDMFLNYQLHRTCGHTRELISPVCIHPLRIQALDAHSGIET